MEDTVKKPVAKPRTRGRAAEEIVIEDEDESPPPQPKPATKGPPAKRVL